MNTTTMDPTTKIDAEFLILCVEREIARRVEQKKASIEDASRMFPAINRPDVFVSRRADMAFVKTSEDLMTLLSAVDKIEVERTYTGWDHESTIVLRMALPPQFVARIPYIRMNHIPKIFTDADRVVMKKMPPKDGRESEVMILCRTMLPVWSDGLWEETVGEIGGDGKYIKTGRKGTLSKSVMEEYSSVTVKIRKEDLTMKSWFPGRDINTGVCNSLGEAFVLVGPHEYPRKKERQPRASATATAVNEAELTLGQLL